MSKQTKNMKEKREGKPLGSKILRAAEKKKPNFLKNAVRKY